MSFDNIAVRVQDLSKCYLIYDRPEDRLKQSVYPRLQRILGRKPKSYGHEFWALRNVSFEVIKGETLGIIGRNGSGKSTLLQIICSTLTPTSGNVETHGRISALLELGSGFNPEFTGRENVYMNCAVMGMSKDDIDARFDDIITFADIGEFIEQPVKFYSSGMFVRLAFAAAINVDPDILIVDEALAVGDSHFVQKCLRKFEQFQEQGTTILYVSHDVNSIKQFCQEAILLDRGEIIDRGSPKDVVDVYNAITAEKIAADIRGEKIFSSKQVADKRKEVTNQRYGTGEAEIFEVEILGEDGIPKRSFATLEETTIRIKAIAKSDLKNLLVGISIRNRLRVDMYMINTLWQDINLGNLIKDEILIVDFRQKMTLGPGEYFLNVAISQDTPLGIQRLDWIADHLNFYIASKHREKMGGFCNLDTKVSFHTIKKKLHNGVGA